MTCNNRQIILHITPGLSTGGAERALVRLIQSSQGNQLEHHVISLTDKNTQGEILESFGIPVYQINIKGFFSLPHGIRKLRSLVKQIQPDIIHGWMYHGGLFSLTAGSKAPKILGVRHSLHDLKNDKFTTRRLIYLLAQFSKKFSAIVYNSATSKKQHEAIGYSTKNSLHIPNGFDPEAFKPSEEKRPSTRKALGVPQNSFVFCSIGRYHPVKNYIGLLDAFAQLIQSKPKTMLVLIGSGLTKNNPVLSAHVQKVGVEDNLLLLGERQDIPELLQAMDCYVSASHAEAFPNVIGEAMATGVPCIATDVGDSAHIIGDTGLLVHPSDTEALAEAMMKAVEMSPENLKTLGANPRNRIITHFQQGVVTKQFEDLYARLFNTA